MEALEKVVDYVEAYTLVISFSTEVVEENIVGMVGS